MAKTRACNTCPFRKGTKNYGHADWFIDVMRGLMFQRLEHTCHKTDPKADGYVGHKGGKQSICMGAVGMTKAEHNNTHDGRVLELIYQGKLDWADVSTEGLFQRGRDFVLRHGKAICGPEFPNSTLRNVPRGT